MADSSNWRVRAPVDPNAQPRRNNYASRRPRDGESREGQTLERQPIVSQAERSRSDDVKVHRPQRQHEDSAETSQAIIEGRRIYLGNLLYSTKVEDIHAFLADNGFPEVQNVHISIDRFSGRNPGYCFIEFAEKETADDAMERLEGALLFDRPVKCRPCQPKGNQRQTSRWPREEGRDEPTTANSRWGNWGRPTGESGDRQRNGGSSQISKAQDEGRQLYVGGLPRMLDQAENEQEMRDLFKEFEVEAVSKRVSPRQGQEFTPEDSERRNFCFVDFATREQAQSAKDALHGTSYRDAPLKVNEATPRADRDARRRERTDRGF